MGAFDGALSYKIFFADEDLPPKWKKHFLERLEKHQFRQLTPENEEGETVGWVRIDRPLSTEFSTHNVLYNQYLAVSLRHDRYVIPSALKEAHLQEAIEEYKRENDTAQVSKYEKDDLEQRVVRTLREDQLPKMRLIDMVWNVKTGRIRFWSQASKWAEIFQGIFEETFQQTIRPAGPYVTAIRSGIDSTKQEWLQEVGATKFV